MRSVASRREDIQKKIQLLREERAREQKAYDEILAKEVNMTPAEIAEAARQKAIEEEPTSIDVGGTTVFVGDYVLTVDDQHTLLAAEKGIFIPDPIKQVYLGERGKVLRVLPSFQGKPAVELCFADGAIKVFLTDCLSFGHSNVRRQQQQQRRSSSTAVEGKSGHVEPTAFRVPEFVPPPKPEPLPQPSWGTIDIPRRPPNLKASKSEFNSVKTKSPSPSSSSTTTGITKITGTMTNTLLIPPTTVGNGGDRVSSNNSFSLSEQKQSEPAIMMGNSQGRDVGSSHDHAPVGLNTNLEKTIGLVKEVLSNQRQGNSAGEHLGSPLEYDEVPPMPLITTGEHDNLLKTPRVDLMSYSHTRRSNYSVTNSSIRSSGRSIPPTCPANYKARFSLKDKNTGIPRLGAKPTSSDAVRCKIAGFTSHQTGLIFVPFLLRKGTNTLESLLSDITQTLKWRPVGTNAKRLFTTDGVEITRLNDIQNGMSIVATPGQVYTPDSTSAKVSTAVTVVKTTSSAEFTPLSETKQNRCVSRRTSTNTSVQSKVADKQNQRQQTLTTSTKTLSSANELQPSEVSSVKGISKPISVRVFSNGEYGDRVTDRFPFRTVTLRPIHKTMRAVFNTIERELEWHSMGKKVERIFDATGVEITSVEELYDGESLVVSTGEKFIIPHPTSVLHEDVMKLSASINLTPAQTRANTKKL
ncbi:Doublecortin domain [Trypanosoma melophagium]|uniref:Doublecortin domain n=1 Tax=Trypanosoma melophagium TaxID=715481 RepID=UPI003519F0A3|nr:Doublecortin domain [Trypanosoma melophagium]